MSGAFIRSCVGEPLKRNVRRRHHETDERLAQHHCIEVASAARRRPTAARHWLRRHARSRHSGWLRTTTVPMIVRLRRLSPSDVHTGRTGASTRINNFVNRGPEFDNIYIYPPLLSACCQIIGGPFKLSGMRARTLHAGAPAEEIHVDVKHQANGWPLVGCILMVDAFSAENGATRFVPGSHLQTREPGEVMNNPKDDHPEQVLACGPVGSIVIFNASVWHGYSANKSSYTSAFDSGTLCSSRSQASPDDPSQRTHPETLLRIGDLAKYVLNVGTSNKPMHATCEDARA